MRLNFARNSQKARFADKSLVKDLGGEYYVNPYKKVFQPKPERQQLLEFAGQVEFNKGLYHNEHFETMIQNYVDLKQKYSQTNPGDVELKKQLCADQWKNLRHYVKTRTNELPEELDFNETMINNLFQVWLTTKRKGKSDVDPKDLVEFVYEYTKIYKFQIPIEPLYLYQMFHPHKGFMLNLHRNVEWEEMQDILKINIVATYEHLSGQSLLGNTISSMAYWDFYLKGTGMEASGYMDENEFYRFLKYFRFPKEFLERSDFVKEFDFLAKNENLDLDSDIVPFDVYRMIFQERNL